MSTNGFTFGALDIEEHRWLQRSPYAVLYFMSCVGRITHSRLENLLTRLGVEDTPAARQLTRAITETLLRGGDIYRIGDRAYAPFPRYAVQRGDDEWIIIGDCIGDNLLARSGYRYEIHSTVDGDTVFLERVLMVPPEESLSVLKSTGIRVYKLEDLLELVPDVRLLVIPLPWPNLQPGAFVKWEALRPDGHWIEVQSQTEAPEGLCRGSATDQQDRIVFVRYFFRHRDGWSPLTADEALLWALKTAAASGEPRVAEYLVSSECLCLPARIPYSAYVVVRFLGDCITVTRDTIEVNGIDYDISKAICEKLGLQFVTRRD
jgi:hypothetical protein